jgi:Uri superfamily endonuclease
VGWATKGPAVNVSACEQPGYDTRERHTAASDSVSSFLKALASSGVGSSDCTYSTHFFPRSPTEVIVKMKDREERQEGDGGAEGADG